MNKYKIIFGMNISNFKKKLNISEKLKHNNTLKFIKLYIDINKIKKNHMMCQHAIWR